MSSSSPSPTISEPVGRFLAAPRTASLASVGPDGAPHQTFIWYGLDPDHTILVNSLIGRRWPAELARDGRAALAIANVANQLSWVGLSAVVIAVDDDPKRALADIIALAHRYNEHPSPASLDAFRSQRRISFRLRITAVHDHLRAPDV